VEDVKHFSNLVASYNAVVMGRKTYKAMHIRIEPGKLCVVLTRTPEDFSKEEVGGRLEFTKETPVELIARLKKKGYTKLLLIGGGYTNAAFLEAGLVNELYLTIEPFIFGVGAELVSGPALDTTLNLMDFRKLNSRGTLLLRYRVASEKS